MSISSAVPDRAFTVSFSQLDEGTVLAELRGALELDSAEELLIALDGHLADGRHLALDLSGLTFVDSTGLARLLGVIRSAEEDNRRVRLFGPLRFQPARVMRITGLHRTIPVLESRQRPDRGVARPVTGS